MTEKEFSKLRRQELLELLLMQGKEQRQLEEELRDKEEQIHKLQLGYEHLKQRLDGKDEKIAELKEQLNEAAGQNEKLKEQFNEEGRKLERLKGELAERGRHYEELKAELTRRNKRFDKILAEHLDEKGKKLILQLHNMRKRFK